MIRDVLNHLGVKIGELELPDETPEEVWQSKLEKYQVTPAAQVFPIITPRQIRLALLRVNITSEMVIAAIEATIPEPTKTLALIEWEYSIGYDRNAPFVGAVGALLGLSDSQIDDLWINGGQI